MLRENFSPLSRASFDEKCMFVNYVVENFLLKQFRWLEVCVNYKFLGYLAFWAFFKMFKNTFAEPTPNEPTSIGKNEKILFQASQSGTLVEFNNGKFFATLAQNSPFLAWISRAKKSSPHDPQWTTISHVSFPPASLMQFNKKRLSCVSVDVCVCLFVERDEKKGWEGEKHSTREKTFPPT